MRPTPDLAGFDAAQRDLRERFGQDVTFHIPVAATYSGQTDPESGTPFDPWATPTSGGGETNVVKRASIVARPLGGGVSDDAQAAPLGIMGADRIGLILSNEDWADVQAATAVTAFGERFKITDSRPDGLATSRRRVIYATKG